MTLTFPTISEVQSRLSNELILAVNAGQLDSSKHIDPNIRNSGIKGLVNAMAAGFDENNDLIKQLLLQLFPQTATDEYLELWASFFGITRESSVKATGFIVFTGTAGTSIPLGTLVQKADGTQYATLTTTAISTSSSSVASITRSGTIATVTTVSEHNLATGISVTISGAGQADYNITATITVTSTTTFTYTVANSPATPATGTILFSATTAYIDILADDFGVDGNSVSGSQLTLISPILNVDSSCFVAYDGLAEGLDLEDDDSLRTRLQERTANFTAPFTAAGLPIFIKEKVSGVTRIWVQTATPSAGYVTIYFTRDNDTTIIPTGSQVTAVKNAIIDVDTGIKPANTPDSYVVVSAPTAVSVPFTFTVLSPNTAAMRTAITTTLTDYFKSDSVAVGLDIPANEYNALIYSVIDADGNSPIFTLTAPAGAITIADTELAVIGTITYPAS